MRPPAHLGHQVAGADHSADRTGDQRAGELLGLDRDRAPVRGHHAQVEPGAGLAGGLAHPLELLATGLGGVGLDQGRVQPREVAAHRIQLARQEDRDVGGQLGGQLADPLLVLGVAIAVEQRDDDPLDVGVAQLGERGTRLVLVQRDRRLAEPVDPLPHPLDEAAGDERFVVVVGGDVQAVRVGIAEVGLDAALEPERVLGAAGDDDADPAPLALEQPVEHRRARVDAGDDSRQRRRRLAVPVGEGVARRGHESHRLVLRGGLGLADHELAGPVDDERVGHRPAGVDRQHPGVAAVGVLGGHGRQTTQDRPICCACSWRPPGPGGGGAPGGDSARTTCVETIMSCSARLDSSHSGHR